MAHGLASNFFVNQKINRSQSVFRQLTDRSASKHPNITSTPYSEHTNVFLTSMKYREGEEERFVRMLKRRKERSEGLFLL